jgi:transcriptional regulator with XRE-family HTH domain
MRDALLQALGDRVRHLRQKQGFSQERLAARCELDRTYISGIERGRRNPSLRSVKKIAVELGVSLSLLFKGID